MVVRNPQCRRNAIICFALVIIVIILSACMNNDLSGYRNIQLDFLKVSEVSIRGDDKAQISSWGVCENGQIVILRNESMSIYDGNTGKKISVYPLDTVYQQVECRGNKQYLISEQMRIISIVGDGQVIDISVPDSVKQDWHADVSPTGENILLKCVGQSYIYDMASNTWNQYRDYHFVGEDGLSYFYNNGKVHAYDMKGRSVAVFSTVPYDPSPLYTIGISSYGDWHLIAEPMVDKSGEDDVEIIVLNIRRKTVGKYKLKNGWYKLRGSNIFQMEEGSQGMITVTKWHIVEAHK